MHEGDACRQMFTNLGPDVAVSSPSPLWTLVQGNFDFYQNSLCAQTCALWDHWLFILVGQMCSSSHLTATKSDSNAFESDIS